MPIPRNEFVAGKTPETPQALIEKFMREHPNEAYTAEEIDSLIHPNGQGQYNILLTIQDMRSLQTRGVVESRSVATSKGDQVYYAFHGVKNH